MGKHRIVINPYNESSVTAAVEEIRKIFEEFNKKVSLLLKALAEVGEEAASGAFGKAVTVTTEPIENGYKISADGKAVVFLEFGAGWGTDSGAKYASKMPFPVSVGSYSKDPSCHPNGQPGEFYQTGYDHWTFGGVEYTEVKATYGMQKAYEQIKQKIRTKAQEIFK